MEIKMPYEEIQRTVQRAHTVNMENRETMSLTGVEDVSGFDENVVVLSTQLGDLTVRGSELHIDKIDLNSGELELRGKIQELTYDEPRQSGGLWHKLFG